MSPLFSAVTLDGHILGHEHSTGSHLFFFGVAHGKPHLLEKAYPHLSFHRLKQVHGDRLFEISSDQPPSLISSAATEADAHWTPLAHHAPMIATADCIPLLVAHPQYVCAIHAGWRGVQNEIVLKSLHTLHSKFGRLEDLQIFIGPHIRMKSFEVDFSLAQKFQQQFSGYGSKKLIYKKSLKNPKKAYVNLAQILHEQLLLCAVDPSKVHDCDIDTMTDFRFASYRRENGSPLRNLSFVARLVK